VELAGGLYDEKSGVVGLQRALQLLDSVRIVADRQLLANRMDVHVASFFTDVDSDIDSGCARFERDLALHAGLGSPSSVQAGREGRTDPANPRI
jgi:hypothetical protein